MPSNFSMYNIDWSNWAIEEFANASREYDMNQFILSMKESTRGSLDNIFSTFDSISDFTSPEMLDMASEERIWREHLNSELSGIE